MAGGRQREFDTQQALEKAMHVFWKKGYKAASLADLTEGMGINKPSMYAAFGNKEQLFVQATAHYMENYANSHVQFLHQRDRPLKQRLMAYMHSAVNAQCDDKGAKGCFISLCVSEAAGESLPKEACDAITQARDFGEMYLTDFLINEQAKGRLNKNQVPHELALFLITILHGTAALSRAGKPVNVLQKTINKAFTHLHVFD